MTVSAARPSLYLNWITPTQIFVHLVGIYLMNAWYLSKSTNIRLTEQGIGILGIIGNIFGAYADLRSFLFWKNIPIQQLENDCWTDITVILLVIIPTAISSLYVSYDASINNSAISFTFKCVIYVYFILELLVSLSILAIEDNDKFQLINFMHHLILFGYLLLLNKSMIIKKQTIQMMKIK